MECSQEQNGQRGNGKLVPEEGLGGSGESKVSGGQGAGINDSPPPGSARRTPRDPGGIPS